MNFSTSQNFGSKLIFRFSEGPYTTRYAVLGPHMRFQTLTSNFEKNIVAEVFCKKNSIRFLMLFEISKIETFIAESRSVLEGSSIGLRATLGA